MPRTARQAPGGMVFHVLNCGVGRMRLFEKVADYVVFEWILAETLEVWKSGRCGSVPGASCPTTGIVNQAETAAELDALRRCPTRGRPYVGPVWTERTTRWLGLGNTFRSRGRPPKARDDE